MTLDELKPGQSAIIKSVGGEGALRQHFLDMGLIPTTKIKLLKLAPLGDPMQLVVKGYNLSLRKADAADIEVGEPYIDTEEEIEIDPKDEERRAHRSHPGYGEDGIYHSKENEHPLPKGTQLTFALVGNQNSGKTTLFNQLTGMNQHVGNFPGVTVDRKSGPIKGYADTLVTDLPGIYSLSPYTSEEVVSRDFIINEKPRAIINIVDANNIERNLYLTMQLMELNVPMVLALNMIDEVKGNGGAIRVNELEAQLGIPVLPISAKNNEGITELVEHAIHLAKYQESQGRFDICSKDECGGAVHRCLHSIMHLIEDHAQAAGIPIRFAASKVVEGDTLVMDALKLSVNEVKTIRHIVSQMEEERGLDSLSAIADMRFSFIRKVCDSTVIKPRETKEHKRSLKIDRVLTGRFTSIPLFIAIMGLIFWLTFDVVGGTLQDLLDDGISYISDITDACLTKAGVNDAIHSLVIDGIFGGVGSVLSFIPIIVVLFFFLSLLEDTGYMARIAFVMDKPLRRIGLSGRSVVPMLIGFGCSVPAVMSSRTLPSAKDRKITILLTPYMSCTAKLPIYAFFASVFFPDSSTLVMISLYLLGIFVAIVLALVAKLIKVKSETAPFVMELPNYRMPSVINVARLLWDKAKDFLQRAFTIIFVASIIIWCLQSFDFRLNLVEDSGDSMLAQIADLLSPIFAPAGLADWRIVTALIAGFMAKESVVSTLSVLIGSTETMLGMLSPLAVVSLLVFCLLYTPCVAAIASIKRELGAKWAIFVIILQCSVAWVASVLIYNIF